MKAAWSGLQSTVMVAVETALPALGLEELSPSSTRMEPHGRASKCIVDSVLGRPASRALTSSLPLGGNATFPED